MSSEATKESPWEVVVTCSVSCNWVPVLLCSSVVVVVVNVVVASPESSTRCVVSVPDHVVSHAFQFTGPRPVCGSNPSAANCCWVAVKLSCDIILGSNLTWSVQTSDDGVNSIFPM
jgi:hypothetical protein